MKFEKLDIVGAYLVGLDLHIDDRGSFARVFCKQEFLKMGIDFEVQQINQGFSKKAGTLRGMHYQVAPKEEAKIFFCKIGKIFDVIVDLRPNSPTYKKWQSVELSGDDNKLIFIPKGCAHGYQTLVDDSQVEYLVSEFYSPEFEKGILWNDPAFNIPWPFATPILSEKDKKWQFWS